MSASVRFSLMGAALSGCLALAPLFAADPAESPASKAPAGEKSGSMENSAAFPAPRDTPASWVKRHELAMKVMKESTIDLLFIGDTVVDRWGGHRELWVETYGKRHPFDLGVTGDRTQNVLWRLQNGELDGLKPKLAVVMVGTMNAHDNSAEEIAEGIKAIVGEIRKRTPETKILLLAIFPRGTKPNPLREKNAEASKLASAVADDKQVFYLDLDKKFLDEEGDALPGVMSSDGLNLNKKGYEIWAAAMEPKIEELMGEKN